jgi:outer membrane protein insertion porin family
MKIIYKYFIFFFIFFLPFNVISKPLLISGLNKLNINNINALSEIDIFKKNLSIQEINILIKDLYKSDLIYEINFIENDNEFLFEITESKIIENIYINGNLRLKDDQILNIINSKTESLFLKNLIQDDISLIENLYLNQGLVGTDIQVVVEKYSEDRVNIIFTILEKTPVNLTSINFIGNQTFKDKYLYSLLNVNINNKYNIFKTGSNLNPSLFRFDKNNLIRFYKNEGFLDAQIEYQLRKVSGFDYALDYFIKENNRTRITEVIYEFDESSIIKIVNNFKNSINKNIFFNFKLINDHLIELDNFSSLANEPNTQHSFELIKVTDDETKLIIRKKNTQAYIINKIDIIGNKITKDFTIRSKLSFEPGDISNKNIFEISSINLNRLPYVNEVKISEIISNGKSNITVKVDEYTKTGNFLFGGSFSGDTGFGLGLSIKDANLFGSGNQIEASVNSNEEKVLFSINYFNSPLTNTNMTNRYSIFNQENDVSGSFGYKTIKRGIGYGLNYRYNDIINLSANLDYSYVKGYSAINNSSQVTDNIGEFNNLVSQLTMSYNSTDDDLYPKDGMKNNLELTISPNGISDDAFYRFVIKNSIYHKLKFSDNFLFIVNNFGISESLDGSKLKTNNSFSLGGLNFRGFDFRGIGPISNNIYLGGNKFFTTTLGYGSSFIFDEKDNINLKFFYTMGSVWDSEYTNNNDFKLRSSAGVSFDFITVIGPVSFSFAFPIEKESTDKTDEFTFSIGSSF